MTKHARTLAAGLLVLVGTGVVRPQESTDARAIIQKAVQTVGGEARLTNNKAATWKEKGTFYGMGDGLPYTGSYAIQWPDKFRMEIHGVFTLVLNGDKGWMKNMGETKEMPKEKLALERRNQRAGWVTSLVPLIKDQSFRLKALGESNLNDKRPVQGVLVTHKDYPDVRLYFDKKTGLLAKSAFKTRSQSDKEVLMETYYSDFRDVKGAKVPHHLIMKRDGMLFVEADIQNWQGADKLPDKVFAKP